MEKYVILHGSFGSNDGNWFPWLKKELQSKGKQVSAPQMPVDAEKQFADTITDKQIIIKDGGHLNSESGFNKFEEILGYIN